MESSIPKASNGLEPAILKRKSTKSTPDTYLYLPEKHKINTKAELARLQIFLKMDGKSIPLIHKFNLGEQDLNRDRVELLDKRCLSTKKKHQRHKQNNTREMSSLAPMGHVM